MHLGHFSEEVGASCLNNVRCDSLHRGGSAGEREAQLLGGLTHPVDESLPGQNGGCGYRYVTLSFGALLHDHFAFLRSWTQCTQEHLFLRELVTQCPGAVRT